MYKRQNQGSSLIEIGEVLKDFPLFTLDIVSFDLLIGTRLREKDYIKEKMCIRDSIYTDEELYKAFNLPQKYIDIIESVIKERK